jgi:DNA-binding SARP family transcriptional activator
MSHGDMKERAEETLAAIQGGGLLTSNHDRSVLARNVLALLGEVDRYREALTQALATLSAKEREVVRYREALERIVKLDDEEPGFDPSPDYWTGIGTAVQIALVAVGGDPE